MILTLILLVVSAYVAYRYSKSEIDPDLSLFNMAAFTGSWYGRDFVDCKPPAIHLWFWLLAKIVGKNIQRVRFAHHFLLGACGILVAYLTNSFWNGLAFTVLINSAWMYAFHGNVGQVPALAVAIALVVPSGWIAVAALGLAVFFEPKLLLTALLIVALQGYWIPASVYLAAAAILLLLIPRQWLRWTWESSFTIPKRMGKLRVEHRLYADWVPWYSAQAMLYILPWVYLAVVARPEWQYWLPAVAYALMIGYSKVIRQNHMLPLAAWIACAGISPLAILALVALDFVSAGLYLGDIWLRHYTGLRMTNIAAREIGEWLKGKPGTIWVNDYHTGVYLYAGKPVVYGMTEQIELNARSDERREAFKKEWAENPPDWVVQGREHIVNFQPTGYKLVSKHRSGMYEVYKKKE